MRLPSAVSVRRGLAVQVDLPVDRIGLAGIYLEKADSNLINYTVRQTYTQSEIRCPLKTQLREKGQLLELMRSYFSYKLCKRYNVDHSLQRNEIFL